MYSISFVLFLLSCSLFLFRFLLIVSSNPSILPFSSCFLLSGIPHTDRSEIFAYYRSKMLGFRFSFDILSLFPTELALSFLPTCYLPYLRLNRILRLYHLPYYYEQTVQFFVVRSMLTSHAARRIIQLILSASALGHWVACFWIVLTHYSGTRMMID